MILKRKAFTRASAFTLYLEAGLLIPTYVFTWFTFTSISISNEAMQRCSQHHFHLYILTTSHMLCACAIKAILPVSILILGGEALVRTSAMTSSPTRSPGPADQPICLKAPRSASGARTVGPAACTVAGPPDHPQQQAVTQNPFNSNPQPLHLDDKKQRISMLTLLVACASQQPRHHEQRTCICSSTVVAYLTLPCPAPRCSLSRLLPHILGSEPQLLVPLY